MLAQTPGVSFGAAAAAVEEEHKLLGDNYEDPICFRTCFGCQQAPALSPHSTAGPLNVGFGVGMHTTQREEPKQSCLSLEHAETLPGLSPAKDSP